MTIDSLGISITTWCDGGASTTRTENISPVGSGEKVSNLHPFSRVVYIQGIQAGPQSFGV